MSTVYSKQPKLSKSKRRRNESPQTFLQTNAPNPLTIPELLMTILQWLSPQELIPLRALCRQWRSTINSIFTTTTRVEFFTDRRSELTPFSLQLTSHYLPSVRRLTVSSLMTRFASLTHLSFHPSTEARMVAEVLQQLPNSACAAKLVTLSMGHNIKVPTLRWTDRSRQRSMQAIAALPQLRRLQLNMAAFPLPPPEMIARLHSLDFTFHLVTVRPSHRERHQESEVERNWRKWVPILGPECHSLGFRTDCFFDTNRVEQLLKQNQSVMSALTSLALVGLFNHTEDLGPMFLTMITRGCPQLQRLELQFSYMFLINATTWGMIASLRHLRRLSLSSSYTIAWNGDSLTKELDKFCLPSMPNVEWLYLDRMGLVKKVRPEMSKTQKNDQIVSGNDGQGIEIHPRPEKVFNNPNVVNGEVYYDDDNYSSDSDSDSDNDSLNDLNLFHLGAHRGLLLVRGIWSDDEVEDEPEHDDGVPVQPNLNLARLLLRMWPSVRTFNHQSFHMQSVVGPFTEPDRRHELQWRKLLPFPWLPPRPVHLDDVVLRCEATYKKYEFLDD